MLRKIWILSFGLILSSCAGSAYNLPQLSDSEINIAQQNVLNNTSELKVYERSDADYQKILENTTSQLLQNAQPLCNYSGYKSCKFSVAYNPDDIVNAYASEGHKITMYKGLMKYLQNDEEIAAVLAHEMGHHLANHNQEQTINAAAGAAISGLVTSLLYKANDKVGSTSVTAESKQKTINDMMNRGAQIGALSYSKEQEREADLLAAYLLHHANYDLNKSKNIMTVLTKLNGTTKTKSVITDTHPTGIERIASWERAITEIENNPTKLPYIKK
jgi:predicted Zn-dependent protease